MVACSTDCFQGVKGPSEVSTLPQILWCTVFMCVCVREEANEGESM